MIIKQKLCKNENEGILVEEDKWVVDFWIHRRVAQLTGSFITR
jgi:hypothetical protein